MRSHVIRAWKSILAGRAPSLSIEVTKECPLKCPGCYAYEPNHLGDSLGLRQLSDFKKDELVGRILTLVDELKPLHVSLVGGDPMVRYREMEQVIPQLLDRGMHVQIVTSAFRTIPPEWGRMEGLTVSVSIDGLPAEHDVRRAPATYERILKNIAGSRVTVHCTVTAQMMGREGYLDEFVEFWSGREEVKRIWMSFFTPQRGAVSAERLSKPQRAEAVRQLRVLRGRFPKLELPEALLRHFLTPPASPSDCIFARTTETVSADFKTRITPCQFGGDPECTECGCYASMALAAVGAHKLGGFIPVGSLFHASARIGARRAKRPPSSPLVVLPAD